jgi:hypothetical protein
VRAQTEGLWFTRLASKTLKYHVALLKRSLNPAFGAAGIGILARRRFTRLRRAGKASANLSGVAAFDKIVTRFYLGNIQKNVRVFHFTIFFLSTFMI